MIGGSLAGSAAACALARTGARVIVLEKARFPRNKVCGCFLSHEALPILGNMGLGEELRREDLETITRFVLVARGGNRVEADLPAPVLSISRERLDA
ncbi:MAG: FAD-dependent monooxygenase, partial [Thermoanaerobaculia bacterium]|nr:FAD-dependent monooxygenase [Thermoanaerobaculia bacterium]